MGMSALSSPSLSLGLSRSGGGGAPSQFGALSFDGSEQSGTLSFSGSEQSGDFSKVDDA
jgi:hypothetical protein